MNLTEQQQLQARLMIADRMASVGTLAAGVAHELNNPLAFVSSNLRYVEEELCELSALALEDPAAAGAQLAARLADSLTALKEARLGAERMRVIIRDLKSFSRVEAEKVEAVDVRAVLESSIQMTWNELRHRAELVRRFERVPPVRGSGSRLGQVFVNLLVNAAQAIPDGNATRHRITVGIHPTDDGRVCVEVSDTGVGIPPEVLPRIFDPFFTTKPPGMGTGLGLAISHNLIAAVGGTLDVESEPGKGTTFRITLRTHAGATVAKDESGGDPARSCLRRARILAIDDEPLLLNALQRALRREHEIVTCADPREALEALQRSDPPFDLVLCDLMMPELGGPDIYEAVRKSQPELLDRIVFITGGAFSQRAREFLDTVPNPLVHKPFEPAELRSKVAQWVGVSARPEVHLSR